jgi:hypothetical protein
MTHLVLVEVLRGEGSGDGGTLLRGTGPAQPPGRWRRSHAPPCSSFVALHTDHAGRRRGDLDVHG